MTHAAAECASCHRVKPIYGRGLCGGCYGRDWMARNPERVAAWESRRPGVRIRRGPSTQRGMYDPTINRPFHPSGEDGLVHFPRWATIPPLATDVMWLARILAEVRRPRAGRLRGRPIGSFCLLPATRNRLDEIARDRDRHAGASFAYEPDCSHWYAPSDPYWWMRR